MSELSTTIFLDKTMVLLDFCFFANMRVQSTHPNTICGKKLLALPTRKPQDILQQWKHNDQWSSTSVYTQPATNISLNIFESV